MFTKQKLLDLITRAYEYQAAFAATFSAGPDLPSAPDHWSPKDNYAHITAWETRMMDNFVLAQLGEPLPDTSDYNQENDRIYAATHAKSWTELRRMADETHRRVLEYVEAASEDELTGTQGAAWSDNRTIWQGLAGSIGSHSLLHLAQSYLEHGQRDTAVEMQEWLAAALLDLDDAPLPRSYTEYNRACFYALAGDKAKAIAGLKEALKLNPGLTEWSKQDTDFNGVRDDPDFQAIYAAP